jgi:nicotinate phosphoribosyltransferase
MKQGQRVQQPVSLKDIQQRTATSVASLSPATRQLYEPTQLVVEVSDALEQLTQLTKQRQAELKGSG